MAKLLIDKVMETNRSRNIMYMRSTLKLCILKRKEPKVMTVQAKIRQETGIIRNIKMNIRFT